jgi:hypothetical protein
MSWLRASTNQRRLSDRGSRRPQQGINADAADTEQDADFQGYPG